MTFKAVYRPYVGFSSPFWLSAARASTSLRAAFPLFHSRITSPSHQSRWFSQGRFSLPRGCSTSKPFNIGSTLLIGVLFLPTALYAEETKFKSSSSPKPAIFSSIEGKAWVEKIIEKHVEVLWLADAHVRKTEEGHATLQGAYSEQLFGQKYIEFDRTIMTLHCMKLVLDGSHKAYLAFTAAQPEETRLSYENFKALHLQGLKILQSKWGGLSEQQIALAMETALVLGDIGKSEKARELFKPYGISAPDHDDFYGEAMAELMKNPSLCPSFAKLPLKAKELLASVANQAHYGHVTHLEGGANMFTKLMESEIPQKDPLALAFDLFVHTCDVMGALGHVNNKSSIVYNESTHQAMQAMKEAVKVLADPKKTQVDAYNAYLTVRANWLGLNPDESSDRVLARIGAMLRLFTPEEGVVLKESMNGLDPILSDKIARQLDVQREDLPSRTPTYMPAVLVNLLNNPELGNTKEDRLTKAVQLGLPFIARVLEKHKEMLIGHEIDANIPLNFNKMAGFAKTDPKLLNEGFYIDRNGLIHSTSETD